MEWIKKKIVSFSMLKQDNKAEEEQKKKSQTKKKVNPK